MLYEHERAESCSILQPPAVTCDIQLSDIDLLLNCTMHMHGVSLASLPQ